LGGVLLDIHYLKTIEAFGELGLNSPEQAFSKASQAEIFQSFERGQVSEKEFLSYLQSEMPSAKNEALIAGWNAMLGGFPKSRLDFIESINSNYNCFVLSNTNSIHQKAFEKIVDQAVGWENFTSAFKKIYYSHGMNLRKPNVAIFQKVLEEQKLNPKETCFIDDSPQHVEAANQVGILGIHLKDDEEIWDIIPSTFTFS
jgi:putative hydrolase of the HAD superfamily